MLLAVYALGMAAPLFVLAALWDRFDLGSRSRQAVTERSAGSWVTKLGGPTAACPS